MTGKLIKKIVFFVLYPFSKRDYSRFGIDILEKNGFHVHVWDFSPFLYKEVHEEIVKITDLSNYPRIRVFKEKNEALNAIDTLDKESCFVVSLASYGVNTYSIYRALSANKIKYAVFMANSIPLTVCSGHRISEIIKKITAEEIRDKILHLTPKKIFEVLFFKINFNFLNVAPATLCFAGGEKSFVANNYPVNAKTKVMWVHALDYDAYLNEKQNQDKKEERFALFLDEATGFASAYLYLGTKPFVRPENYFRLLCNFFSALEQRYKVRIVIAGHPSYQYERSSDYFGGRQTVKNKTAELVRNCDFVIVHSSTSLNYAVLFKKPIIFITTDELQRSPQGVWIQNMASVFNKRAHNLDRGSDINIDSELYVDNKAYDNYKNDYIKRENSPELPFWQIVAEGIKNL